MIGRTSLFLLCACLFPLSGLAQRTIIVDEAGSGDFTDIQPAVDAANRGDIIRVKWGVYSDVTITKSIKLLGEPPDDEVDLQEVIIDGTLTVKDLPAGETFVGTDLGVQDFKATRVPSISRFRFENCQGGIYLSFIGGDIRAENCTYLALHRCDSGVWSFEDSRIVASRCTLLGEPLGIIALRSEITLIDGWVGNIGSFPPTGPLPSVRLTDSSLIQAEGNRIRGSNCNPPCSPIILDGASKVQTWDGASISIIDTLDDRIIAQLKVSNPNATVALGGSLGGMPIFLPQGDLFADLATFQLLHFGGVQGIGPEGPEARGAAFLPSEAIPNRHITRNHLEAEPLNPDARLIGIPVTFQALVLENNKLRLSLPYTVIL